MPQRAWFWRIHVNPPFFKVDCVVTDPPYGRSSSTLKSTTKQLVEEVLASSLELLGVGQRICIASPKTLNISRIGTAVGLSTCGIPLCLCPSFLNAGDCSVRKGDSMSLRVVFLGTSGSVPTLKRSLPSVVVQCPRDQWMFDCGENVQRQMMAAKVSFHRKMKIFITHLHGDHVLGLPGLLQTMALMDRKEPVQIYGPGGLKDFLVCTKETLNFGLNYPVEINQILSEGVVCDEEEYQVIAIKSNHAVESYAYAFVEKPRPGKFYPKKALALGIAAGELWSKLQSGEEVTLSNGKVVKPS